MENPSLSIPFCHHSSSLVIPSSDPRAYVLSHPRTHDEFLYEPQHDISNNVICVPSKGSDQPAHNRSLISAFASCLNIL